MIKKLHLKNVATFVCENGTDISALSKINFFYGANGSGKTTISRVINKYNGFNSCKIDWDSVPKETYVYNEDFVQENFYQSDIPGVFTLGKEAKQIEEQIIEKKKCLERLNQHIQKNRIVLEDKNKELSQLEIDFSEKCWNQKAKFENDDFGFKEAFKGVRDSKERFKEKVISEIGNENDLKTESFLKEKAKTVFNSNPQIISEIDLVEFDGIEELEKAAILSEKIIGKADVNISSLIAKLGNSDWVKEGVNYLESKDDTCPFCQQSIKDILLKEQLEKYFDETFSNQIAEVSKLKQRYEKFTNAIIGQINSIFEIENQYIDKQALQNKLDIILVQKDINEAIIDEKIDKPSHAFQLHSISDIISDINTLLRDFQDKTTDYNSTVSNLSSEKALLTAQIWKLFVSEIKHDFDSYASKKDSLNSSRKCNFVY